MFLSAEEALHVLPANRVTEGEARYERVKGTGGGDSTRDGIAITWAESRGAGL